MDYTREFGIKQNLRHLDPAMSMVLAWGGEDPPVKNDFTSNKSAFQLRTKINKLGVTFVSEALDNYRIQNPDASQVDAIIQYVKHENQRLIKQKIFNNIRDQELMAHFTTEYQDQSKKQDVLENDKSKQLHQFF